MILTDLKKRTAEVYLGKEMKDVIIIVPYLMFIKKAKKEEGDISHLNILKLINEPITFAIVYCYLFYCLACTHASINK